MSPCYLSKNFAFWSLGCAGILAVILLIPCIIWGSITVTQYVHYRNVREIHTNTTCLLLNYTVRSHDCLHYTGEHGPNTCYDERFLVTYPILNKTSITSVTAILDTENTHHQTQIGNEYRCFYQPAHVTSVIMQLPNEKSMLIQLCVAFGLASLPLLLANLGLFCLLVNKIYGIY